MEVAWGVVGLVDSTRASLVVQEEWIVVLEVEEENMLGKSDARRDGLFVASLVLSVLVLGADVSTFLRSFVEEEVSR